MTSPSFTWSSGTTRSSATVPATGASTGISIFIDSRMAMVSPVATVWPTSTGTCHTLAAISATTSTTGALLSGDGDPNRGRLVGVVGYLIGLIVSGLVIGALGRLAVPGRQPIGCLWTMLVGIAGSLLAGLVGRVLFGENYSAGWILSIACAALLVWLFTRRTRTLT